MQRDKFAQAVLLLVVIFPLVIVLHGENILLILSTGFAGQELGRTQNQVDWKNKDLHAEDKFAQAVLLLVVIFLPVIVLHCRKSHWISSRQAL